MINPDDKPGSSGDLPTLGEVARNPATALGMPRVVGPYHIHSILGEGGFGIVYLAERREPFVQRVALKVLKPGMDTAAVLSRFEQERQSLALMDHPCITHILDAGVTDRGLPFFVMELVQGRKITDYCDDNKLSLQERLDLFIAVCEGVQHAHQKGIIHRDLKPSNILVAFHDNKTIPKIIDFGIAKATTPGLSSRAMVTIVGQVIGTPAYMSPEQASSGGEDLDTRTDIYSLGVLLYELLTGSLPFEEHTLQGAALHEIQRLIREVEPPRPSSRIAKLLSGETTTASSITSNNTRHLFRELKGDLDWIIMKAIEKDRRRRYESAGSLADDLTRYLKHETIAAGPPSTMYRFSKFVRRNRLSVAAVSTISITLVVGLVSSLYLYNHAETQRKLADSQRIEAETQRKLAEEKTREADTHRQQAEAQKAEADKQRARAETEGRDATTAFAFIDEMFSSVDPAIARGKEVTVVDLLDTSSKRSETLLKASPGAEALVRGAIGRAYNQLGSTVEAEAQYKKSYELAVKAWGEDNADTITAKVGLALAQLNLGRLDDALKLLQEARASRTKVLGADHADTIQAMDFESVVLSRLLRYEEALKITRQVVDYREKHLGMDHADTLSSANGLSDLLQQMTRLDEAERVSASAAARADKALGEDAPISLEAHSIHASQLKDLGRYADAAIELEKLSRVQEKVLGPTHNSTLTTLDLLQKALLKTGSKDRSEAIARDVVDRCSKKLGPDNPRTLLYLNNLASTLVQLKKFDDAGKILETVIDRDTQLQGADGEQTITAKNNYALFLSDTGHPDKSIPLFREVIAGLSKIFSPTHWKVGAARGFLAESIAETAKAPAEFEEAAREFQAGYVILKDALKPTHERTKTLAAAAAQKLDGRIPPADLELWKNRAKAE